MEINGVEIGAGGKPYIIAEIGHNHQGSVQTAIKMIIAAHQCGCDAVKLQKRTLDKCYTKAMLRERYNSEHAFGETYGQHRNVLEFGEAEYQQIRDKCAELGMTWFATAFDPWSADFLEKLDVPAYKIASSDLRNKWLLKHIAQKRKPMIISTGGASMEDIFDVEDTLQWKEDVAYMHCVCEYPTRPEHVNLMAIRRMKELLPHRVIGYSCHYNGILMAELAYILGARIFEKHFTLDHTMKGSDHALSLQPDGMRRLVRDLHRIPLALGTGTKRRNEYEKLALRKMAKSIWPIKPIATGETFSPANILPLSPEVDDALHVGLYPLLMGKVARRQCSTSVPLTEDDILWESEL